MRLWSLHPAYLDARGLVALWREGLLAQRVLSGNTAGYRNHPQLERFRMTGNPAGAIASYLRSVADEADRRGYRFDRGRIASRRLRSTMTVTSGQIAFERRHLLGKLKERDPHSYRRLKAAGNTRLHPLFRQVAGDVEEWERP